jgi:predicted aldo/keto reductase-like oxidoreductase
MLTMRYRSDRRSGNELSALGFGCMRFPRRLTATDREKSEELVLAAIERGVNYFDTAYVYGDSEVVLGEILHKNDVRSKIFLATKLPHQKCASAEDFERLFQEQLGRLQTDYIDYYLIHNLPTPELWQRLCDLGIEGWIAQKKANGQIRQLGFSFHGAQAGFLGLLDAYDWDFCQIQYNYMDENYQAGRTGLERAYEKGLPVVIMEPLLGGKLATGLPREAARRFKEADADRSFASWAFRWLWDQPAVTTVLSGMNSAEQLDDNIATASVAEPGMLSAAESAVFGPVVEVFQETYKVSCTGCNYCMPCPSGVNIPGCFAAYNASNAVGFVSAMQLYITSTAVNHPGEGHGAKNCVQCGACEKKCPQHIKIAESLNDVAKRMEPFWFSALMWGIKRFMG